MRSHEPTGGRSEDICTHDREKALWRITLEKLEIIPHGLSSLESERTLRALSKEVSRRQT